MTEEIILTINDVKEALYYLCKDLDGKRFKISEAVIGVNFPPSHPSCRSTCVLDESSINEDLIEE